MPNPPIYDPDNDPFAEPSDEPLATPSSSKVEAASSDLSASASERTNASPHEFDDAAAPVVSEYRLKRAPRPAVETHIDYAAELNPEQHAAVTAPAGPMLVIAGAGSGKTRTLTYRVAFLVENGVEPENILLLTFTNKAAREMLDRVAALLPRDITRIWGGTFHAIGQRMLRRHFGEVGLGQDFTILDAEDAADLAHEALVDAGLDPKQDKELPKGAVAQDIFSFAINTEQSIARVLEIKYAHFLHLAEPLARASAAYHERKRRSNVVDFDDLLALPLRLMKEHEAIRARYQEQFHHVLVDEYQDTNTIQADLVDQFAARHGQLMVVGDDAQSIYSWRGANFRNIISFPDRYPGARVVRIETNYRSTPEILALANEAIAGNSEQFKKELRSARPAQKHPKPALIVLQDSNQQAQFIAQRIAELHEDEGVELNEIAVLYRSHFHALEVQMELTRRQIPFEVTSGLRFFEQAHIKDVAAYLKLAANPKDEVAFKRIAAMLPGVGAKTAAKLWASHRMGHEFETLAPPSKSVAAWTQFTSTLRQLREPAVANKTSEQIRVVVDAVYADYAKTKFPNVQARLEDLNQLRAFAETFATPSEFLAQLALLTNVDGGPHAQDHSRRRRTEDVGPKIRLSTVHQAKGLEWKAVFVIMLCEGCFPSARSSENLAGEEEERRLFYVAVTRARDELYLTYPILRAGAGGSGDRWQEPSRFLGELPRHLTNQWKIVPDRAEY